MPQFLHNPIVQLVLAIVGAAGVIFGVVIWIIDIRGKRKILCYAILKREQFEDKKVVLEIKARYGDKESLSGGDKQRKPFIDKLAFHSHLIVVGIINSGKVAIRPKDYGDPRKGIRLNLGKNAQVWAANIYEANPKSLLPIIESYSPQRVALKPILLNPGDWFTLEMLSWDFDQVNVSGRIAGIKDIGLCTPNSFCRHSNRRLQSLHSLQRRV